MPKNRFPVRLILLFSLLFLLGPTLPALANKKDSLMLALENATDDESRLWPIMSLGDLFIKSDPEKSLQYYQHGFDLAEKVGKPKQKAFALLGIGSIHLNRGLHDEAIEFFQKAIPLFESIDLDQYAIMCKGNIGIVYSRQTDFQKATLIFEQVFDFFKEKNDSTNMAMAMINLAPNYHRLGDNGKAIKIYKEALSISEKMGLIDLSANIHLNLGNTFHSYKQYESANKWFLKALKTYKELEQPQGIANCHFYLGQNYEYQKLYKQAQQQYQLSLSIYRELKDRYGEAMTLHGMALTHCGFGEHHQSKELLKRSLSLKMEMDNHEGSVHTMQLLANEFTHLDELDSAQFYLEKASAFGADRFPETRSDQFLFLAELFGKKGAFTKASEYYKIHLKSKDSLFLESDYAQYEKLRADFNENQLNLNEQQTIIQQQQLELEQAKASRQKVWTMLFGLLTLFLIFGLFWLRERSRVVLKNKILTEKEKGLLAVLKAENQMREKVSRDLHDGVGQLLTALQLKAGTLLPKVDTQTPQLKKDMNALNSLITDVSQEVRSVSNQIKPQPLVDKGIVEALHELIAKSVDPDQLKVHFEYSHEQIKLSGNQEIELYRICQELINNTLKHAEAESLELHLLQYAKVTFLNVQDNGKGFDPVQSLYKGSGLLNIKTRVEMLGGKLTMEKLLPKGQITKIQLPE